MIYPSGSNVFGDSKGIFCPLGVLYTPSSTVVEGHGILWRRHFFSMTQLMFSDIKSVIGTSMGYMTGGMELLRVIGISMEVGFDHFEQINSLII